MLGGEITGLNVIRNLGINEVDVYCVVDKTDCATYSKYCKKSFIIPNIQTDKALLKTFLHEMEKTYEGAVIIPTSDLFLLNLASIENEVSNKFHTLIPKANTLRTIVEKDRFYKSLAHSAIPHPTTFFPKSIEDVEKISRTIQYPVIIKPFLSQVFSKLFNRKVFYANSAKDLLTEYKIAATKNITIVVQEIIPGLNNELYSIAGYFDKNHNPKALFAYRRLRGWPQDFGNNSYVESCSLSNVDPIKKEIINYLHKLQYCGIMEAEIKRDPRDGLFKLIEINARSWWQNSLPTKCGINIIYLSYLDSIGVKMPYSQHYRTGVHWMHPLNDFQFFLRFHPEKLMNWLNSLRKTEDFAYFCKHDMLPWLVKNFQNIMSLTEFGFNKIIHHFPH